MEDLSKLINIGDVLAKELTEIGVTSHADLAAMGSVTAVLNIGATDRQACYNMLYALEGAIQGIRWHQLPKAERAKVKEQFDAAVGE
jgi:DNA transformation protein